ncbi:hypothetical protein CB1_001179006 [Camelus ferus]|nr:hypothetical protein CB1_001179006 [Camelus ferus]
MKEGVPRKEKKIKAKKTQRLKVRGRMKLTIMTNNCKGVGNGAKPDSRTSANMLDCSAKGLSATAFLFLYQGGASRPLRPLPQQMRLRGEERPFRCLQRYFMILDTIDC